VVFARVADVLSSQPFARSCALICAGRILADGGSIVMNQRGFTLPEVLVAIAFFTIVSGIGSAILGPAVTTARIDSQVKRVIGFLQLARETAITRQRDVELLVDEDAGVFRLVRIDEGVEVPFMELALESRVQLRRFDDMGDTPDRFGGAGAVNFGTAARLLFISDGSLVGDDDMPVNGTLYLAMAGQPETARAITLTGTTARPRSYRWMGESWIAR
jgi:prepilin-type N-terminal cleavage/methylation domain-containing protein